MICRKCGKDFPKLGARGGKCYICSAKEPHEEEIRKLLKEGFWTIEEIDTIIYKMIYDNIETINELNHFLSNKSLKDIYVLLDKKLKLGGMCCKRRIKVKCNYCGKNIIITFDDFKRHIKKKEHFYCSYECMGFGRVGKYVGKNSSRYNKVDCNCDFCGIPIKVMMYRYKEKRKDGSPANHFCSKKCADKYRSKYYSGENHPMYGVKFDEERLKRMKEIGAESVNKSKRTMTLPHILINKLLEEQKISYENEKKMQYYSIDISLSDTLMIEIMGDYWHTNPTYKTTKELSKVQKKNITHDKQKMNFIKNQYGINILYLWEKDIKENIEVCRLLINKYIQENSVLEDYNSFNYYVNDNGKLCLKEEIIKPYFMM